MPGVSAQVEGALPSSSLLSVCSVRSCCHHLLVAYSTSFSCLLWVATVISLRGVSWAAWERMRPNGGVTLEPAVRGDMGRVEGCKVASGGQLVEAAIHRWDEREAT